MSMRSRARSLSVLNFTYWSCRAQVYAHALLNLWTGTRNNYVALFDMDEYMVIDPRGKRIDDLGRECWPDYAEIHLHRQVPQTKDPVEACNVHVRLVASPKAAHAAMRQYRAALCSCFESCRSSLTVWWACREQHAKMPRTVAAWRRTPVAGSTSRMACRTQFRSSHS